MPDAITVALAATRLRAGELVAIPTETVYGLAADARNPQAVSKIFTAKGRPADHPLIVHLPDISHLSQWAIDIPESAYVLAHAFWPGPLTLILKRHPSVPDAVTGGQDTVGVRVPNHPRTLALLHEFNGGLAAPSANKFGRISPTTAAHVHDEFAGEIPVLDGGACAVGIESTIVDLSRDTPRILRPGDISAEALARALHSNLAADASDRDAPRVSGSLAAHYAPRTPMRLVAKAELAEQLMRYVQAGRRVAVLARHAAPAGTAAACWRMAADEAPAFARHLYANLRELDAKGADVILVQALPTTPEWVAVADRLNRAVTGSGP